jgi:DNA anti-recombination protein RmuC
MGYKQLEKERKEIESRIDRIKRELRRAEEDLSRIDGALDLKVNGYKKMLQSKIDSLGEEFHALVTQLEEQDQAT